MYKFISYSDWLDNYSKDYPNARCNIERTEVVLSCKFGEGDTIREAALLYIDTNWTKAGEE